MNKVAFGEISFLDSILSWWFLIVMFYTHVLFYTISQIINLNIRKNILVVFAVVLAFVLLIQVFYHGAPNAPLHIEILPMAFLFFLIGYYFKGIKDISVYQLDLKGCFFLLVPVLVIISSINPPVMMYNNTYGNLVIFSIGSLLGIYITWVIASYLKENQFLRWMGKNSIIIYVLQFKVIQVFTGIDSRITTDTPFYILYLTVFLLSLFTLLPLTVFCKKYLRFAFGHD